MSRTNMSSGAVKSTHIGSHRPRRGSAYNSYLQPSCGVGWLQWRLSSPGQNGNCARGAIRPDEILSSRDSSACPRVGLTDVPFERFFSLQLLVGNQNSFKHVVPSRSLGNLRVGLELGAVFTYRPDDTCQFVSSCSSPEYDLSVHSLVDRRVFPTDGRQLHLNTRP